jgi:serine/threonine protein kinase
MSSDDAQTKALRTEPLRTDPFGTDVDPVIELVDVEDVTLASEVARFQPVGVLGRGGMGEVRLMRDLRIRRPVAFKVLRSKLAGDRAYRTRFLTEARIQGQLEHPSIVPVHDLGETSDGSPRARLRPKEAWGPCPTLDLLASASSTSR